MTLEKMLMKLPYVVPTEEEGNDKLEVVKEEGYIPNLYYYWDIEKWCVDWIHYSESDSLFVIEGNTPTEAVTNAYNYCLSKGLIKEDFKERMLKEHHELEERLTKLKTALNKDGFHKKVGDHQYELMKQQAKGMEMYYQALSKRLADMDLLHMDAGN